MNEVATKLVIALSIFLVSLFSAAAPLKVINVNDQVFSCGNLLASGVLLSASLVHQLPDSMENLEYLPLDFPMATFVAGLTFCLFLILEENVHSSLEDGNPFEGEGKHSDDGNFENHLGASVIYPDIDPVKKEVDEEEDEKKRNVLEQQHLMAEEAIIRQQRQQQERRTNSVSSSTSKTSNPYHRSSFTFVLTSNDNKNHRSSAPLPSFQGRFADNESTALLFRQQSMGHGIIGGTGGGMLSIQKSVRPSVFNTWRKMSFDTQHPVHHHDDHLAEHMHGSLLASLLLLCALSVHSILEGLAIGISSNISEVMSTAAAVLAHKAFAGYALGSSMIASQMNDGHFFVLITAFAFCSTVGILLGLLLEAIVTDIAGNDDSSTNTAVGAIVTGIVQAMVSGTFLYVSIVEIGMKEIVLHRDSSTSSDTTKTTTTTTTTSNRKGLSARTVDVWKLASFLFGYLSMSFLAIWV